MFVGNSRFVVDRTAKNIFHVCTTVFLQHLKCDMTKIGDVFPDKMAEKEEPKFLKKAERKACWDARDRYWECLDKSGQEETACAPMRELYEKNCPSQWVVHFDRKHKFSVFKARVEKEGLENLDKEFGKKNKQDETS